MQDILSRHLGETKARNDAYLKHLTDQIEPCAECGEKHEPMISCEDNRADRLYEREDI